MAPANWDSSGFVFHKATWHSAIKSLFIMHVIWHGERTADKMFATAQVFGMGILIFAMIVFFTNIFMLGLFLSRSLISINHDCAMIYRLIFNFIVCDTIQITPTIYIGLCNVLQRGLLPEILEVIPGTINLWSWYQMMLMLVIMAGNRYIAVCHFNKYVMIFTARTSVLIIIIAWLISGIYTVIAQFIVPCCAMVTYYPIFTFIYSNPNSQENYVDKYQPPVDQIVVVVLLFCYIRIFFVLRRNARLLASSLSSAAQQSRSRQNVRFAIQCVFVSMFFVIMYVFYIVFPKLLSKDVMLPYSAIAFCLICHCSVNSISCLAFNPEIRQMALQILRCQKSTASGGVTRILRRSQVSGAIVP